MKYVTVCVAGTFDGLHRGHEALLRAAFDHGSHVVIALTSDSFVKKYKTHRVADFVIRRRVLYRWLQKKGLQNRAEIISLETVVGPAATAAYDALIVTDQNRKNGEYINVLRVQNGKSPLVLIDVPLIAAQDKNIISSTRVRSGEIDRSGRLVMPDNMREELSHPLGSIVSHARPGLACVISVGDMTTKTLLDAHVTIALIIMDNMVNRKEYTSLVPLLAKLHAPTRKVQSGPGYISKEAVAVINAWARDPRKQIVLEVAGEEDLLTLPAIAYAPVGSVLYYGQPGKGIVEVTVTPEKKEQVHGLLKKFVVQ